MDTEWRKTTKRQFSGMRSRQSRYISAQRELGDCYYNGEGVDQDYEEAVKWYEKAAGTGERRSAEEAG